MKRSGIFKNWTTLKGCIASIFLLSSSSANGQLSIGDWENYSQLAEQGAICAGFASLMETQDVISEDIGRLWIERRKYSGALIRNAGRLETGSSPNTKDINNTISIYRDWIFSTLVQSNENPNSGDSENIFENGQAQIRQLLQTNCVEVYVQADKAILDRFPELARLTTEAQDRLQQTGDQQKLTELLAANIELNKQLKEANEELQSRKIPLPDIIIEPLEAPQRNDILIAGADEIEDNTEQTRPNTEASNKEAEVKVAIAIPKTRPQVPANTAVSAPNKAKPRSDANSTEELFVAQLGAFNAESEASNNIRELNTNRPELFKNINLVIEGYTYPSGNSLYRVMTPPLERDIIIKLCEELWTERVGCLIKSAQ